MFENGHPHWLLEASFAAWLLWLASFALCSSRHRQPGAASMTSVMNIAVEESPLQHGEHGAILVILPRKCGQNSHWNRWKWTSILVRPWIIFDSGPVFRCNMMQQPTDHCLGWWRKPPTTRMIQSLHAPSGITIRWIIVRRARPESQGKSVLGDVLLRRQ